MDFFPTYDLIFVYACATDEEIASKTVNFAMSKSYPNLLSENKMEPILYEQDMSTYFYLDKDAQQISNIFFMNSSISLEDSVVDFFDVEERDLELFEVDSVQQVHRSAFDGQPLADRKLISIYLRTAKTKRAYKREEYGFLEYMGELGGIRDIVMLFASFFTANVIKRIYYAAMVAKTLAIQHYNLDMTQYYASKSTTDELTEENSSRLSSSDDHKKKSSRVESSRNSFGQTPGLSNKD